jgi:hypothetical protein
MRILRFVAGAEPDENFGNPIRRTTHDSKTPMAMAASPSAATC